MIRFMDRQRFMAVIWPMHPDWDWSRALWEWHLHHIFMCRVLDSKFPRETM